MSVIELFPKPLYIGIETQDNTALYNQITSMTDQPSDVLSNDGGWGAFETIVEQEGDEVVTKVEMPTVPGAEAVLEAAEKFYEFVNGKTSK